MVNKKLLVASLFSSIFLYAQTPYAQGVKAFEAKNYSEAIRYYFIAARAHDINAYLELGKIHQYGVGTGINPQTAYYWYDKAAQQDHPEAQYRIGYLFENGLGLVKDSTKAAEWYRKAAEGGNQKAKDRLAGKSVNEERYPTTAQKESGDIFEQFTFLGKDTKSSTQQQSKESGNIFDGFTSKNTDKNTSAPTAQQQPENNASSADKLPKKDEKSIFDRFTFGNSDKNTAAATIQPESNKSTQPSIINKTLQATETNTGTKENNESFADKLRFWEK